MVQVTSLFSMFLHSHMGGLLDLDLINMLQVTNYHGEKEDLVLPRFDNSSMYNHLSRVI